jgi:predicted Kef-type K+ transport protein
MKDLSEPRAMYLKAVLFVGIGIIASAVLLIEHPSLRVALLLAVIIWAFCRAYYFAFYVVQHYADPSFRFAGLIDFGRYLWRRRGR